MEYNKIGVVHTSWDEMQKETVRCAGIPNYGGMCLLFESGATAWVHADGSFHPDGVTSSDIGHSGTKIFTSDDWRRIAGRGKYAKSKPGETVEITDELKRIGSSALRQIADILEREAAQ